MVKSSFTPLMTLRTMVLTAKKRRIEKLLMMENPSSRVPICKWRRGPTSRISAIKMFLGGTSVLSMKNLMVSPGRNLVLNCHLPAKEDRANRLVKRRSGTHRFNLRINMTNNFKIKTIKLWRRRKIKKKPKRLWMMCQRERRFLRRMKISHKRVSRLTGNSIVCLSKKRGTSL